MKQAGRQWLKVPDWRVLLPLAAATLLLAAGVFLAWQAGLVHRAGAASRDADALRERLAADLGRYIEAESTRVSTALESAPVQAALAGDEGRERARAALAAALPEAGAITFFTPHLDEILSGDLGALGYDKAAALMRAKVDSGETLAQLYVPRGSAARGADTQRLLLARPAIVEGRVLAYAAVELPFAPVLERFQQGRLDGARLELRQGDGRGDLTIAAIGSATGSTATDPGIPVPGSLLRIGKADPEYFIVLPARFGLLAVLAVLALVAGAVALWLRQVGLQHAMGLLQRSPRSRDPEITLAEAMRSAPEDSASPAPVAAATAALPAAETGAGAVPGVELDPAIFRMYDIRGVVGGGLDAGIATLIGRAVGSEARERGLDSIVVGRDGRLSGPELADALIQGLREAGLDVIDIGLAPTPVTYFACYHLETGSGISVTGSHNPPDYNGFKIVLGGETLSGEAIQGLYQRIAEGRFSEGMGGLQHRDVGEDYIERIAGDIQLDRPLKVVVDCGNGVAGAVAPAVLEAIGCEVEPLYCEVDGTFPNHHPDPSEPENLADLILSVRQLKADLGLAFDGDGDRLGVVTPDGEVVFPDRLLMLFAMDILDRNPGATIVYDVKCTGHLQPLILQHGGSPMMWRTGHSLIKARMRETGAALAGEMSGHFFFAERWYGFDDGIYSAARLLEILAADPDERAPAEVLNALPNSVSTPELKVPLAEGEHYRYMERFAAQASFPDARITTIDGIRADWADGWGLVRASNTTPVLVLRFDADSAEALARIKEVFRAQLLAVDPNLNLPF